jgi:hypothetical protein
MSSMQGIRSVIVSITQCALPSFATCAIAAVFDVAQEAI